MVLDVKEFPILKTERLILRQIEKSDANSILNYMSDKDVMRYYGLDPFQTVEDALEEIIWYHSTFYKKTGIRWGITLKDENIVIGSCGFLNIVAQHYRTEIGYELSKSFWGLGIASEALNAIIAYGFKHLGLQRIEALIEPLNLPSQKLAERQGFIREGLLRNYEFTGGKFDDLYMYSMLRRDFEKTLTQKHNTSP